MTVILCYYLHRRVSGHHIQMMDLYSGHSILGISHFEVQVSPPGPSAPGTPSSHCHSHNHLSPDSICSGSSLRWSFLLQSWLEWECQEYCHSICERQNCWNCVLRQWRVVPFSSVFSNTPIGTDCSSWLRCLPWLGRWSWVTLQSLWNEEQAKLPFLTFSKVFQMNTHLAFG